jgi:uncharacterized membrane protein
MEQLEKALIFTAENAIVVFEIIGMVFIIFFTVQAVVNILRRKKSVRLDFTKGLALSLEFLLASEILRTIIVREVNDLLIVGGIVVMRIAFTLLIHLEINGERNSREKN